MGTQAERDAVAIIRDQARGKGKAIGYLLALNETETDIRGLVSAIGERTSTFATDLATKLETQADDEIRGTVAAEYPDAGLFANQVRDYVRDKLIDPIGTNRPVYNDHETDVHFDTGVVLLLIELAISFGTRLAEMSEQTFDDYMNQLAIDLADD